MGYEYLGVTVSILPINLDRFRLTKNTKNVATILKFYDGDEWVLLRKTGVSCTKNIKG